MRSQCVQEATQPSAGVGGPGAAGSGWGHAASQRCMLAAAELVHQAGAFQARFQSSGGLSKQRHRRVHGRDTYNADSSRFTLLALQSQVQPNILCRLCRART